MAERCDNPGGWQMYTCWHCELAGTSTDPLYRVRIVDKETGQQAGKHTLVEMHKGCIHGATLMLRDGFEWRA